MIQLREKDLPAADLKQLAEKTLELTRLYGARLLLNGHAELAAEIGADGVQLGIKSCPITTARDILGPQALIGYSAHSLREVKNAAARGADFATFSPIYSTASKAEYGPPQGLQALCDLCHASPLPVYALGGITADQVGDVFVAGACGVAVISAILGAVDPRQATEQMLQQIDQSRLSTSQ